jgi:hypothetical protein
MGDHPGHGAGTTAGGHGHGQRVEDEFGAHVDGHRVAEHRWTQKDHAWRSRPAQVRGAGSGVMSDLFSAAFGRRKLLELGAGAAAGMRVPPTRSAACPLGMGGWFSQPIGRWQAGDVPHAYRLPDGRFVWLLNDSFVADGPGEWPNVSTTFVRNAACVEQREGLRFVDRHGKSFLDAGEDRFDRWWWFHGGVVAGSLLHVVATEMVRTGPPGWAINFEPSSTWVASIAWRSLDILDLRPAPNAGVTPVYGFSVASNAHWTYLFGNNHLYGRATTDNYVARVPRGELLDEPAYWDGARWVAEPAAAVAVHSGGRYARRLAVVRLGRRWLATAKDEEFFGHDLLALEADAPMGPWRVIRRLRLPTKSGDDRTVTYDAMARPLGPHRLLVWWSNNAYDEADVRANPSWYRPSFASIWV